MLPSLDRLPDDPAALEAIILAQQEEVARLTASARAYEALVQASRSALHGCSGRSSDRARRRSNARSNSQLTLEDLEVAMAAAGRTPTDRTTPSCSLRRRSLPRNAVAASPGSPITRRANVSCSIQAIAAPSAAAPCVSLARTSPRSSTSSPPS